MESKPISLYRKFIEMQNEINKHKWIESEKKGIDIGFEEALLDWVSKHRSKWRDYIHECKK